MTRHRSTMGSALPRFEILSATEDTGWGFLGVACLMASQSNVECGLLETEVVLTLGSILGRNSKGIACGEIWTRMRCLCLLTLDSHIS